MFSTQEAVTGIDLGSSGIKLVRARTGRGLRRLLNAAVADLPEGAGSWPEAATTALRQLLDQQGLKPRDLGQVLAAVSGPSVHLRQVEMPALSETELRTSLRYEARQHLPIENIADAALDCQVIHRSEEGKGNQSVLMVGAPDALVQSRIKVLAAAGIEPEVVDAAPLALLNALEGAEPEAMAPGRTVAVLDLGASAATLVLARKGGVVYARSLAIPSRTGTPPAGLVPAVRETVQFFAQMNERRPVDLLFVCGGGATDGSVARELGGPLGLPVKVLDATRRLTYSPARGQTPGSEELAALSPRLAVALGLLYWGDGSV